MIDVVAERIVRKNPFLKEWPYYGIIDVLNPVATAQYQHAVTIASKSGMAHNFRDLRFFQPDGTEIPFWNESKTDGSTSYNWFKPYYASLKNIYCFYGNRDAVSQSNGEKTFDFFDDFLGSALDSSKWTQTNSPGSLTVSGGICSWTCGSSNTQRGISSIATFGQNFELIGYVKEAIGSANNTYAWFGFGSVANATNEVSIYKYLATGKLTGNTKNSGASSTVDIINGNDTSYFRLAIKRNGSTSCIFTANTTTQSITTNVSSATQKVEIVGMTDAGTAPTIYVDCVAVKKYTSTEPTCQFNTYGLRNPMRC